MKALIVLTSLVYSLSQAFAEAPPREPNASSINIGNMVDSTVFGAKGVFTLPASLASTTSGAGGGDGGGPGEDPQNRYRDHYYRVIRIFIESDNYSDESLLEGVMDQEGSTDAFRALFVEVLEEHGGNITPRETLCIMIERAGDIGNGYAQFCEYDDEV